MAKVSMKLEGFEQLQRALVTAPELVRTHSVVALNTSAFAIAQRARSLVPVATGTLKGSIDVLRSVTKLTSGVGINSSDAYYWRFVEFGTVRMAARPFFRPAAEEESEAFIQRFRDIGPRIERDLSVSRFV